MGKNIVICSDGTGNRGGKTRGTNVWRIFSAVDRHRQDTLQITYYDDGVGTEGIPGGGFSPALPVTASLVISWKPTLFLP